MHQSHLQTQSFKLIREPLAAVRRIVASKIVRPSLQRHSTPMLSATLLVSTIGD